MILFLVGTAAHLPSRVLISADDEYIVFHMNKKCGYFIEFSNIACITHNTAQMMIQTQSGAIFYSLSVPQPELTAQLLHELLLNYASCRALEEEIERVESLQEELYRLRDAYDTRCAVGRFYPQEEYEISA
jgi:hypothetical protein